MYALFRLLLGAHFASRATIPCTCALLPACAGSEAGGRQGGAAPSLLTLCPASSQNLTYEIILTLGQAFEVAYQLALQAQKARPIGASATEVIETRSSKPVPKPRAGVRKSAVRGSRPREGRVEGLFLLQAPRAAAVTPPVSVCFAPRPRCRRPPIAVVSVTPAPPTVLLTSRCRLLVLKPRSRHPLCVSASPRDRELLGPLGPRPRARLSRAAPHRPSVLCLSLLSVLPSPELRGARCGLAWESSLAPQFGFSKPLPRLLRQEPPWAKGPTLGQARGPQPAHAPRRPPPGTLLRGAAAAPDPGAGALAEDRAPGDTEAGRPL